MLAIKILLAVLTVVSVGGTLFTLHKLQKLIDAIVALHQDISVIRLDNARTMADLRRRNR